MQTVKVRVVRVRRSAWACAAVALAAGALATLSVADTKPDPAPAPPATDAPATTPSGTGADGGATAPATKSDAPDAKGDDPGADAAEAAAKEALAAEEARVKAAGVPVLSFTMTTIDGREQPLSAYAGRVLVIVNTASRCGFTRQYKGLEDLYQKQKPRGFEVLAFPANDFGSQEPGTNAEILEFCTGADSAYKVTFPLFAKISVTGDNQHPLYRTLSAQPAPIGGDPKWNFTKFLVDRAGVVRGRFDSRIRPDDPEFLRQVEQLLAEPVPAAGATPTATPPATPEAAPAATPAATPPSAK